MMTGERRLFQTLVAICCLVPLGAGALGVSRGPDMMARHVQPTLVDLDSHFRYLSGLLLGIGIAFAASIPTIERRSELFVVLTGMVVVGGMARLASLFIHGMPNVSQQLALIMELAVVPALFAWQQRLARKYRAELRT